MIQPKSSDEWEISVPRIHPESTQRFIWARHTLGNAVLIVAQNYQKFLGQTLDVLTESVTYNRFAEILTKGMFGFNDCVITSGVDHDSMAFALLQDPV